MSIMLSLMCRGVHHAENQSKVLHDREDVVGDISGPLLGTGLYVTTKKQTKVVILSTWSSDSLKHSRLMHLIVIYLSDGADFFVD